MLQALELNNLRADVIMGDTTLKQRSQTLENFSQVEGPDVVMISEVGSTGINLASAHVMVIIVSGLLLSDYRISHSASILRISASRTLKSNSLWGD